jgi:hypothetical protein
MGGELPNKIGTAKLWQAVTLLARQEQLVWGGLPKDVPMSPGSAVIVEPTSSKSMPPDTIVGRVVTLMRGDRWVTMKVTNLSDKPIPLKSNRQLVVSPCLAVEDFEIFHGVGEVENTSPEEHATPINPSDLEEWLQVVGLSDLDLRSSHTDHKGREKLVQLIEHYNDVFSKHALDCGESKGFVVCSVALIREFHLPSIRHCDKP